MCDERLWQFTQQSIDESLTFLHVPIPMENSIQGILDALVTTLPDEPVNLLGFSMGGYIACAFAAKYPERIKRLMVLSNTASGLLDTERQQREVALNWVSKQGYHGIPKKKAVAMLGSSYKDRDDLLDIIFSMDKALGEAVFIQQLKSSLERPELLPELKSVSFALRFIVGGDDVLLSKDLVSEMQLSKAFDIKTLGGCGHMLPLEQPRELAALIEDFYH